jgi:hypothetical protein
MRSQGTWNILILELKGSSDVIIILEWCYNHFYTNRCSQCSENNLFPQPEKRDGEAVARGKQIILSDLGLIMLRVSDYKKPSS